jgi:hypothetical protein
MFMLGKRDIVAAAGMAVFGLIFLTGAPGAFAGDDAPPAAATPAQSAPDQDEGFFRSILKKTNMVTDTAEPQDFVVKSRPAAPTDYVPVFRPTVEHKTKILTPDQLKSMDAELDAASSHNAKIRDAFPPARKAYVEAERDKAAKAASKRAKTPASTTTAVQ